MASDQAFVTLATNDQYALGAMVMASSLRQQNTTKQIAIMITSGVSDSLRPVLNQFFDLVQMVNVLESNDAKILQALRRPELAVTLTKIHCWRLQQYSKCVFMDADTLVVKNIDDLFERDELSAVPDIGWPDCFNSGVFVFRPNQKTFDDLVELAATEGSFDGGDQGLLNTYFSDWATKDIARHLSFVYNMTLTSTYSYLPAFKRFGQNVRVVHFLGSLKPWNCSYDSGSGKVTTYIGNPQAQQFIERWWRVMSEKVQPAIEQLNVLDSFNRMSVATPSMPSSHSYSGQSPQQQQQQPGSSGDRYDAWMRGQIDYLGADSFENIQKRLDAAIHGQGDQNTQ